MSLTAHKSANGAPHANMLAQERAEIIAGLQKQQKKISPKYFYDERGSLLFDRICDLPEYYPTRTEQDIMRTHLDEMSACIGPGAAVIEYGAGSNAKARQLLRGLDTPVAYVPVEISGEYLAAQAAELEVEFPFLSIRPVVADFTKPFDLPRHPVEPQRNLIFFPGSTIGNFSRGYAADLLRGMLEKARPGGALLIGVDLIKDETVVKAAYNDSQGVTARFNLNSLRHLRDGLGASFEPENFRHEAVYDREHDRIEMRLVSLKAHEVRIADTSIAFECGEWIVTEHSHKYSIDGFRELASSAGWRHEVVWTDPASLFSVHFLCAP